MSPENLPSSLLSIGPKHLQYLQQDEVLLRTTRALTYDSHAPRHALIYNANKNIDKADELESRLHRVQKLRKEVGALQSEEIEAKKEWQKTEEQMRSIIKPFTMEGIHQRISDQIRRLQRHADDVQSEIFRRNNLSPEESIVLSRRYVEACTNLQLLERTRDGLLPYLSSRNK